MDIVPPTKRTVSVLADLNRRLLYGLLRLFIRNKPFKGTLPIAKLSSVLIIPYGDAIGDMIVASPIWRAVKRQNPNCRIGVFTSVRNESLLRADPDVDALYRFEGRRDFDHRSELRRARKEGFDLVLNVHFTNQTDYGFIANYVGPKSIKLTGAHPRREMYQLFFNHIGSRVRHSVHLSFLSLELLAEVVEFDPPLRVGDAYPSIAISIEAEKAVAERLRTLMPEACTSYILIHMQAGTPFREWGRANAIQLAERLSARYPNRLILFTASPMMFPAVSKAVGDIPLESAGRIQAFETSPDLLELAALIRGAELVITPETSITHFASATATTDHPTSVLVLMSNRDRIPMEWLPFGIPARILAPPIAGEPVATISVADVFDAAVSLLDRKWITTQTYLDTERPQHPLYRHSNRERLLSECDVAAPSSDIVTE